MTLDRGACCLLVTGAPGAGKSTVTRALTQTLSRSALLDGYVVSTMVVGGYLWPLGEPRDEALRQSDLCVRNLGQEQFFFDDYDGLEASMRAGFGDRGWWFDTAGLTADETVRRILLEADERGRVSPPPAGP